MAPAAAYDDLAVTSETKHPLRSISFKRDGIEDWDEYPFCLPVIRALGTLEIRSPVCFFAGENGTGKSTLLEAMALNFGFGTQGGGKHSAHAFEADSDELELAKHLYLIWTRKPLDGYFLRAESFFNIATYIDKLEEEDPGRAYAPYGGISLHERSHGESFLALFQHRLAGQGFYVLDEPETALSPQRQLAFLVILNQLLGEPGTQFVIATHSPILLAYPGAQIVSFSSGQIREVAYRDTEAYQLTAGFLASPEQYIKRLLE